MMEVLKVGLLLSIFAAVFLILIYLSVESNPLKKPETKRTFFFLYFQNFFKRKRKKN